MKTQSIVIVGSGGHAREIAQLVEQINARSERFKLLGFLDIDPATHGTPRLDYNVLGALNWISNCGVDRLGVVLGLGSPSAKHKTCEALATWNLDYPNLVHPDCELHTSVELGQGVVICRGSHLTVDLELQDFVCLNRRVDVAHDCMVGAHCTINPGTILSGGIKLGAGCDIGTCSSFVQYKTLGEGVVLGAGATVTNDLPDNVTAVGVPARVVKTLAPWRER